MATLGEDISMFSELLVMGGSVVGDWIGGVVEDLGPFISPKSRGFSVSSVKLAFCFLFGKHMANSEGGELVTRHLYVELNPTTIAGESRLPEFSWVQVG